MRILSLSFGLAWGSALAQEPLLTVTDGATTVELTVPELSEMQQDVIETSTVWTEGVQRFSGPAMTDVLEAAGMAGETVAVEALDGYSIDVPRANLTGDGAILATSLNDQPLPEDRAPYWIVFPYDRSPEMNDQDHQDWSVWAVTRLTLK